MNNNRCTYIKWIVIYIEISRSQNWVLSIENDQEESRPSTRQSPSKCLFKICFLILQCEKIEAR